MGLLQKLKSALGFDGTGSSESGRSGDVDVTVEREPSTADEDAVKGTETASSATTAEPEDSATADADDPESAEPAPDEFETLADESDDAEADEAEGADETAEAEEDAETAEATEAEEDAETSEATEAEEDAETAEATDTDETEEPAEADATEAAGSTDPVTELNGIGPAYGDRLAGAGIETVGELAAADAAEVADQIGLGESRVAGWIEQAEDY